MYRKEEGGKYSFLDAPEQHLSWFKGNVSNVVPEQAADFFRDIMKQGKSQGMGAFEVDFMNYQYSLYDRFASDPGAFAQWARGLDEAAREADVSVQYCMALPSELLNSVALKQVTSARVSPDGGRPYYNAAATQLLVASLGVRPFKDNAWTSGSFPKGLPDIVGSVLMMGPVGLADRLNTTIAEVAQVACAQDGTLLHPSRPATPLDALYLPNAPSGSIMVTHSTPAQQQGDGHPQWFIAVASGVNKTVAVTAADLWAPAKGLVAQERIYWRWQDEACVPGAPVSGCVKAFPASGMPVSAATNAVELFHVAPLLPGGWAVLGETSKAVPMAAARFDSVSTTSGESENASVAHICLRGSPSEYVSVLLARVNVPGSGLLLRNVSLPSSGSTCISVS